MSSFGSVPTTPAFGCCTATSMYTCRSVCPPLFRLETGRTYPQYHMGSPDATTMFQI
nr:unnamed protein product [Callosobruchus chinensis]